MQYQKPVLVQGQHLKMNPQLYQSIQLMALPLQELKLRIGQELQMNPALEVVEDNSTVSLEDADEQTTEEQYEYFEDSSDPGMTRTGYDDEAAAIAALPGTPAGDTSVGRTTVLTASGFTFIGGTSALQGGTGGNVSDDTNYVSTPGNALTTIETITRWDFGKGPMFLTLPVIYGSKFDQALSLELEASGTGGTTGRVTAWIAGP